MDAVGWYRRKVNYDSTTTGCALINVVITLIFSINLAGRKPYYSSSSSRMSTTVTMAKDTLHDGAFIRSCPSPYSHAQVIAYLECIKWPVPTATPDEFDSSLDNLHLLMYLHFVAFPFSNTDLH